MKISRNNIIKIKFYFLLILLSFGASCTGDDGEIGPTGATGADGADGSSAIIVKTFETDEGTYLDWESGVYLGSSASVYSISDSDITEDVLEKSFILVYFQFSGDDVWYPMLANYVSSGGVNEVITYTYSLGNLSIYAFSNTGIIEPDVTAIKYFIVSGSTIMEKNNVSYEEVIAFYKLDY